MKTAVITAAIGDRHQHIAALSHPTIAAYAEKIGAEFIVIKDRNRPDPKSEKFRLFNLFNRYNRIIWIDNDIIVRQDCPNLFDQIPYEKLGLYNEGSFIDHSEDIKEMLNGTGERLEKWDSNFYNLGVIVASRPHKFLFSLPTMDTKSCDDLINFRILKGKIGVEDLHYRFNRMGFLDQLTGEHRRNSYMIHYRNTTKLLAPDVQLSLIKSDLDDWKQNAPDFNYKRHLLVKTNGGLGDEMCAEPVIRYMVEKVYKGADIVVATFFPRLFAHLPVRIVDINYFRPEQDTPYHVINTLVGTDNIAWKFMSPNLMSATDFISQMSLRMILPDADKQFKLGVNFEDVAEVLDIIGIRSMSDLVLVHPGRGWPSKTFPADYWSDVIAGIAGAGYKVALIGRDMGEDQGTVPIKIPDGVADTRNLLSLGGLIAIISQAKVLVSNDSSPVHLAGAFDNHIVLIPTCKHPDHVLPMRHGARYHKAVSLHGEKLLWDDIDPAPIRFGSQTIDKVPGGDIMRYLPKPDAVLQAVQKAYPRDIK